VYGYLAILLLEEPVISRLFSRNRQIVVLRVQDPGSSHQAFCRVGGQSRSIDGWQNGYSYDILGTIAGFRKIMMGPKASMIRFRNPTVVPIV
jgi:hypothetical protein